MHTLFGADNDFLHHTLRYAGAPVEPRSTQLADGTRVSLLGLGALLCEPSQPANPHQLVISAGVHGNETAPIEVCNQLVNDVLLGHLPVRVRTLFLLGNPQGMVAATREIRHNMNRLFCGQHLLPAYAQSDEGRRAAQLEAWVDEFVQPDKPLFHYDLHTAIRGSKFEKFAVYPFVPGRVLPKDQREFLAASDILTVLLQQGGAHTFSAHTSIRYGAQSFTLELGKVRPFGQNDLSRFAAIARSLAALISAEPLSPADGGSYVVEYRVVHEIINTGPNFVLHIPEDVENFTAYEAGSLIWEDDQLEYRVLGDPQYIVFPNSKVGPGQRAGLLVCRKD